MVVGFAIVITILILMIITTTVTSIVDQTNDEITEADLEEMISTIYNDISTYIQIEHIYGKYSQTDEGRMIKQIALQINPLFSIDVPLDGIIIEVIGNQDVQMMYYSGCASSILPYSLFGHLAWNNVSSAQFSIVSIFDTDASIEQNDVINDCTDRAYIIIGLSEDLWISHTEHIEMNIIFKSGVNRGLNLQAPFSTKDIIQFF
jgi:archaellin